MIGIRWERVILLPVLIVWTLSCAGDYLVFIAVFYRSSNPKPLCTVHHFKCIHFLSLNQIKRWAQSNYTCIIRSRDMMDFMPANTSPLQKRKKKSFLISHFQSPWWLQPRKTSHARTSAVPLPFIFISLHPNMSSFYCDRVVRNTGGMKDEGRGQEGPWSRCSAGDYMLSQQRRQLATQNLQNGMSGVTQ